MAASMRGALRSQALPKAMRTQQLQSIRVTPMVKSAAPVRSSFVPLRGSFATQAKSEVTAYTIDERGPKDTLEYRVFFKQGDKEVSPWHSIPLYAGEGALHYICEIPKETSAKMEVATDEPSTPIKQDVKKGKLRFYPYNINWNYGLLPQTWEDPAIKDENCGGVAGDNDPVDVVEIGSTQHKRGGVYAVKPLGCYAMIDDGELDWKVLAIAIDDPKASQVNDVEDVERVFPGELKKILEWFRDYKIPDGKPANKFGYENQALNKEFTLQVVKETHEAYVHLKSGQRANDGGLSLI